MGADKPNGTHLPKGKPLGSYMIAWNYVVHMGIPTMIGWTRGGMVHRKLSAMKVTHPSTLPALGSLTSEFHGIQLKALCS